MGGGGALVLRFHSGSPVSLQAISGSVSKQSAGEKSALPTLHSASCTTQGCSVLPPTGFYWLTCLKGVGTCSPEEESGGLRRCGTRDLNPASLPYKDSALTRCRPVPHDVLLVSDGLSPYRAAYRTAVVTRTRTEYVGQSDLHTRDNCIAAYQTTGYVASQQGQTAAPDHAVELLSPTDRYEMVWILLPSSSGLARLTSCTKI